MKSNDIKQLHNKSITELQKQLIELQSKFINAKLEKKAGKSTNYKLVSELADDIARVKTVVKEKTLAVQAQKLAVKTSQTKKANQD